MHLLHISLKIVASLLCSLNSSFDEDCSLLAEPWILGVPKTLPSHPLFLEDYIHSVVAQNSEADCCTSDSGALQASSSLPTHNPQNQGNLSEGSTPQGDVADEGKGVDETKCTDCQFHC